MPLALARQLCGLVTALLEQLLATNGPRDGEAAVSPPLTLDILPLPSPLPLPPGRLLPRLSP